MSRIEFTVLGKPQPGGSKRWLPAKGRAGGRPLVVDDNPKTKPWQAVVGAAAYEAMRDRPVLEGPLLLEVTFYLARPAGHYGSGRNAHVIKASSPRFPATRPDVTKLVRALEDAMTGIVWRDDAQVVTQDARKRYGHPERAVVLVWQVQPAGELSDAIAPLEGLFA